HILLHAPSTTELYTLSLHDALPICVGGAGEPLPDEEELHQVAPATRHDRVDADTRNVGAADRRQAHALAREGSAEDVTPGNRARSEEHTSELQSRSDLVCRLLLEKK